MAGRAMISLSAARSLLKPQNSSVLASRFGHEGPAFLVYDFKKGREVVGFGVNGEECYADHPIFPYPAIRYKRIEGPLIVSIFRKRHPCDISFCTRDLSLNVNSSIFFKLPKN